MIFVKEINLFSNFVLELLLVTQCTTSTLYAMVDVECREGYMDKVMVTVEGPAPRFSTGLYKLSNWALTLRTVLSQFWEHGWT
jgi:hypothetical protein